MSKKGLILFVDDEYYLLSTLKAIVKTEFRRYNIQFAENGDEALELLKSLEPFEKLVVFSDWQMPGMKGDELLIEIHQRYPQSINYLLSGMITKEPEEDTFERGGIVKVLFKPWNNKELLDILRNTLDDDFTK
jgi:response regulator RpfG family c-di-GMP phosphodiesterase